MFDRLYSRRAAELHDSSLKEVLETHPDIISFAGGLPDEKAFEYDRIKWVAERAMRESQAWQYAPTEGFLSLREAVAEMMQDLGIRAEAANVLITQGSQQGLDLVNMLLVNPGEKVLMEAPGYIGAIGAAQNYEANIVPLPLDEEGLVVDTLHDAALTQNAKYLYTVSTYQNPTGNTLSSARREQLVALAREHGFLIVEDGAYQLLRFEGPQVKPIAALSSEHTIYLGSFSKVLVPGTRVGWIVAPEPIVQKLILLKQSVDLAGGSFSQLFVLTWLREFGLCPPIDLYRQKRDRSLAALKRHMPKDVTWNRPHGGFFLWLTLPEGIDTKELLVASRAQGVSFVPGYAFGGPSNTLRFSFSQIGLDQIDEGVVRLSRAIRSFLS